MCCDSRVAFLSILYDKDRKKDKDKKQIFIVTSATLDSAENFKEHTNIPVYEKKEYELENTNDFLYIFPISEYNSVTLNYKSAYI